MGQKATIAPKKTTPAAKPAAKAKPATKAKPAAKASAKAKPAAKAKAPKSMKATKRKPLPPTKPGEVRLLSGGNPQIAKGDGDGPVQAYIAAMPGWKSAIGKRLDELIVRAVPGVQKAVKWNSPFYGVPGQGFFLSHHTFNKYVKVAFLFGSSLEPMPPEASKDKNARYLHIHEDGELDEKQFVSWVKQAAAIPGWTP